jgi:hypothetical protein
LATGGTLKPEAIDISSSSRTIHQIPASFQPLYGFFFFEVVDIPETHSI